MDTPSPSRHIGRKIWYATVITLSVLVLLLSAAGIVGNWIIKNTASQVAISLLETVYTSAGGLRQVVQRIDQGAGEVRQISTEVSQVSLQISQNVEDQGLIVLLLPEEQEIQLADRINSLRETLGTIRETLAASLNLYRAIDRMPFVSLPTLSQEQIDNVEASIAQSQAEVNAMRQSVQDFRSGASGQINRVTQAADKVTAGMDEVSSRMNNLDANLLALQEFATRMQTTIPRALTVFALMIILFLAYVIYGQVEMIRLYVQRWRQLKEPNAALDGTESAPAG